MTPWESARIGLHPESDAGGVSFPPSLASLWDASLFHLIPRVATALAVLPWAYSYAPLVRVEATGRGSISRPSFEDSDKGNRQRESTKGIDKGNRQREGERGSETFNLQMERSRIFGGTAL